MPLLQRSCSAGIDHVALNDVGVGDVKLMVGGVRSEVYDFTNKRYHNVGDCCKLLLLGLLDSVTVGMSPGD